MENVHSIILISGQLVFNYSDVGEEDMIVILEVEKTPALVNSEDVWFTCKGMP